MRRIPWLIPLALTLAATAGHAGQFQKSLKGQWLGAWVVTRVESTSDCAGFYTDNRVNGTLVKGGGALRFEAGELAKLDRVDLKRSRMDLLLTLQEPVLIPYRDGPFTLYREAFCKIELEIELPRAVVREKDTDAVERSLLAILERYASEQDAIASVSYNEREREQYPHDYETTVARHAVWKAEQINLSVQAKIDHAVDETSRLADRIDPDAAYLGGFAEGIVAARGVNLDRCSNLLSIDLGEIRRRAGRTGASRQEVPASWVAGFEDGKVLVYGLEMIRNLPACFVAVPETDDAPASELAYSR